MAQQIKKKFLAPEVISYFDDQIDSVESQLFSEQSARELADQNLQSGIDSEEARALAAEQVLQGNIDSEVTARQAADDLLQTAITTESDNRAAEIADEVAAREAADTAISADLSDEVTRATNAEDTLDAKIDQEIFDRSQAVTDEIAAREAADLVLDGKIATEKGRIDAILSASGADKDTFAEIVELINSVDTENDSALASYVLSNNARSTEIEGDLAQEISDRQAGDQSVQDSVDSEASRALAAEGALSGRIDVLETDPVTKTYVDTEVAGVQSDLDSFKAEKGVASGLASLDSNGKVLSSQLDVSADEISYSPSEWAAGGFSTAPTEVQSALDILAVKEAFGIDYAANDPSDFWEGSIPKVGYALDQLASRISSAETNKAEQTFVEQVQSDFQAADLVLQGNIDSEETRALSAESALSGRLDVLETDPVTKTYVDGEISGLQSQIDNVLSNVDGEALDSLTEIVSAFQSADSTLSGAITTLSQSASSGLASEIAAREAADTALQGEIESEETRALAAESNLQSQVTQEISDREAGDNALDARIEVLENAPVLTIYEDEKHNVGNTLTHVMLDFKAEKIFKVCVGRMNAFKGEDYTVSEVGGKTKITWIGSFASGGSEAVQANEDVFCTYSTFNLPEVGGGVGLLWENKSNYVAEMDGGLTSTNTDSSTSGVIYDNNAISTSSDFEVTYNFDISSEFSNLSLIGFSNDGKSQWSGIYRSGATTYVLYNNNTVAAVSSFGSSNELKLAKVGSDFNVTLNGSVIYTTSSSSLPGQILPAVRMLGGFSVTSASKVV